MRPLSTKLHAALDYLIALLSIISPLIFQFGNGGFETLVPMGFGLLLILYSFVTDYELSFAKDIPLWVHYRMDQLGGLFMAASPWLLGFDEHVYLPNVLIGLALVINSVVTSPELFNIVHSIRTGKWVIGSDKRLPISGN
jgi:hypothetical protein